MDWTTDQPNVASYSHSIPIRDTYDQDGKLIKKEYGLEDAKRFAQVEMDSPSRVTDDPKAFEETIARLTGLPRFTHRKGMRFKDFNK